MQRLTITSPEWSVADLQPAIEAMRAGGIVAFPTETFYGLAVDPRSPEAVGRVFDVKGRASDQPLPLIASDEQQVREQVGTLTPLAARLAAAAWPGPLTLIIPASHHLAPDVHRFTGLVAVRVPGHALARALAAHAGHAITSTSANLSGHPPSTGADEVAAMLGTAIDVVIDGGPTPGGLPSTIVDATGTHPRLVRAGAMPWDRVLEFLH